MNLIVNCHVVDSTNIGDQMSAPFHYFSFPNYEKKILDLGDLTDKKINSKTTEENLKKIIETKSKTLILGGGGLLFSRFDSQYQRLQNLFDSSTDKKIAWGVGQQIYNINNNQKNNFNYDKYLKDYNLVGIRDYNCGYNWLPCASCLNPTLEKKRPVKHPFVVFSHKKYYIKFKGFPHLTNNSQNFEEIIDFLASGETVITSSYHGAYWALLLGKKVLAFPFSSKFFHFKYQPALYPVKNWQPETIKIRPFKETFLNKFFLEIKYGNKYHCRQQKWQTYLEQSQKYDNILPEHQQANKLFYQQVLNLIN